MSARRILIVAGEASGDLHGAALVRALHRLDPTLTFFGLGGTHMQQEGVERLADIDDLAVIGPLEVLKRLPRFRAVFRTVARTADDRSPDAAILIDYPGFNLRLASRLKARGIPVLYYISPQIWAWGRRRLKWIRRLVDLMVVILPFEEALYRDAGIPVRFVGHPLLDHTVPQRNRAEVLRAVGLEAEPLTVGLLPGSREHEVRSHLPILLQAAERLTTHHPAAQFVILRSARLDERLFSLPTERSRPLTVRVVSTTTADLVGACDLALVCSGTATLETALVGTPLVILYRTTWLTALLTRCVLRLPYIGMPNVILGRKAVPECLQEQATPERIAREALVLIPREGVARRTMQRDFEEIRRRLGRPGATERAAQVVREFLQNRS